MKRPSSLTLICVVLGISCFCSVVQGESKVKKIEAFVNWLDDNHFSRNFDIREIPGQGIGGVATRPLTADDYLLKVPVSKLIFGNDHKNVNGWENWSGKVDADPLVIFLLREKLKPNSPWKPYIDIIPDSFEEHPLLWPEEDFQYAELTSIPEFYILTTHTLKASYQHLLETLIAEQPDLFPEDYFTWDNYLWAFLGVTTRSWYFAERKDSAMIPLADMLNHKSGASQGGMQGRKQFAIKSTQAYEPGDQVYDSYGPKTNHELLSYYGFIPEGHNPDNGAILEISLKTKSDLVYNTVEPILRAEDRRYSRIQVKLNQVPHQLLRMFRISALESTELDWLNDIMRFKAVSIKNEQEAMQSAIIFLQQAIAAYPSEEEDLELLARPDINDNNKTIIRLRMSEKQVLEQTIQNIQQLWKNILFDGKLLGGKKI